MRQAALSRPIDFQNIALLGMDCFPVVQAQLSHRPPQNFFGRGVQVEATEVEDRERVVAADKI